MIRVTVRHAEEVIDELEFDGVNIQHHVGNLAMTHHDVMKHCTRAGIWYRVAHAAAWIAETASMSDALTASQVSTLRYATERLLERLQTGWKPKRDEIDPDMPQRDLANWGFGKTGGTLVGYPSDESGWKEISVLWIDANLCWTLCVDGFYWL